MINTICFFNFWHNGDVYSGKGYIQDLISQLPNVKFKYAHSNSLKIVSDIDCEHVHIDTIDKQVVYNIRHIEIDGTLYINTWVGVYALEVFPIGHMHANWCSLYDMWKNIYNLINCSLYVKTSMQDNLFYYIPTTNWKKFDIDSVTKFISEYNKIVLFCNGIVRSKQSNLGLLNNIIVNLAKEFSNISFVCTEKFDKINYNNIHFTDDIFSEVENGDINEIAYLSTKSFMIIGKNSGPFMFTHVKENIADPNKIFVSLSHHISDSYAWGLEGLPCRYYHHSSDDENKVLNLIKKAIYNKNISNPGYIEEV